MITLPKSDARFGWTRHIKNKMVYYGISKAQIMRIFRRPERTEEGIAPETIAAMKTKKSSGKTKNSEIWIMYSLNTKPPIARATGYVSRDTRRSRVTMISAWRYPGKTKPGERPPIPLEILNELTSEGII